MRQLSIVHAAVSPAPAISSSPRRASHTPAPSLEHDELLAQQEEIKGLTLKIKKKQRRIDSFKKREGEILATTERLATQERLLVEKEAAIKEQLAQEQYIHDREVHKLGLKAQIAEKDTLLMSRRKSIAEGALQVARLQSQLAEAVQMISKETGILATSPDGHDAEPGDFAPDLDRHLSTAGVASGGEGDGGDGEESRS